MGKALNALFSRVEKMIGTEYWSEWRVDTTSTDTRAKRLKYRVVAHSWCWDYPGSKSFRAEEIKAIDIEYRESNLIVANESLRSERRVMNENR